MSAINTDFIVLLHDSGFAPKRENRFFRFLIAAGREERPGQEDAFAMRGKFMPVKAVNFLHQPLRPIPGKGMADFLRADKADADVFSPGFHQIKEACPIAESFARTVNPTVVSVLSYAGGTGKTEVFLDSLFVRIRHLISFCPLLFFSSDRYGLLLSSYERGNRESFFSSGCSAGMSFLPCYTPPSVRQCYFRAP